MKQAASDAICVFCGSQPGTKPIYTETATALGKAIAARKQTLVYGGGTSGLMGAIAAGAYSAGGKVHGIIPKALANRERVSKYAPTSGVHIPNALDNPALADQASEEERSIMTVVTSMHERKTKMAALSRGFIVMPGGYGTLEELAEMTTWTQLGIHSKPVICLNIDSFFTPLRDFVENSIASGFIPQKNRAFITFLDTGLEGKTLVETAVELATRDATVTTDLKLDWT